jgi:phasin family protein
MLVSFPSDNGSRKTLDEFGNALHHLALLGKELGLRKCRRMVNPHQEEKSEQGVDDTARRVGEKAAEQTSRIGQAAVDQTARAGQAAAEVGEEVARASANLLRQNVETIQNTWRSGLESATSVMGRSTEQIGVSGEGAQQATEATERSARNAQTLLYTSTAAARVMGDVSQEYFQMVRHQLEKNMDHMRELWTCRTPQDFAAIQTDMMRETVETALESSRRIADMSRKMADEAGKQIKQSMEEIRRTA